MITKAIGLVAVVFAVMFMSYFAVNMLASVPEPEAGTEAHEMYGDLTTITEISFSMMHMVILLLIVVVFIVIVVGFKK